MFIISLSPRIIPAYHKSSINPHSLNSGSQIRVQAEQSLRPNEATDSLISCYKGIEVKS